MNKDDLIFFLGPRKYSTLSEDEIKGFLEEKNLDLAKVSHRILDGEAEFRNRSKVVERIPIFGEHSGFTFEREYLGRFERWSPARQEGQMMQQSLRSRAATEHGVVEIALKHFRSLDKSGKEAMLKRLRRTLNERSKNGR